jgi:hypothetical protein
VCLCIAGGCRSLPIAGGVPPDRATAGAPSAVGGSARVRNDRDRVDTPVHDAVARLLARHLDGAPGRHAPGRGEPVAEPISLPPVTRQVCFVGVVADAPGEAVVTAPLERRVREAVLGRVGKSRTFRAVEPEVVDSALHDARLGPGEPLTDEHLRSLAAALERRGTPVDYFLRATLATGDGTKVSRLTLELVDTSDGGADSESVELPAAEGRLARWWQTGVGAAR